MTINMTKYDDLDEEEIKLFSFIFYYIKFLGVGANFLNFGFKPGGQTFFGRAPGQM